MQDLKDKLTVLHTEDGVVFEDFSMSAFNFIKGTFEVEHTMYVGFTKPLNTLFFAIKNGSPEGSAFDAQYWNGAWTNLELHDESEALATSGFVRWQTPSDHTASHINGKSMFWVKFSLLVDSPVEIRGIGALLCSEEDLRCVDFSLDDTQENILKAMVSARNLLCKEMQVSAWDLLNFPDVTDATTFLSLANIYANQSDRQDDHYMALSKNYLASYYSLKSKLGIQVDKNGDGIADEQEKRRPGVTYLER